MLFSIREGQSQRSKDVGFITKKGSKRSCAMPGQSNFLRINKSLKRLQAFILVLLVTGCVSVPPQIAQTHQKELEVLQALRESHLSMIDSFVNQKKSNFENFFFNTYGPVFIDNWMQSFQEFRGRPYDPLKDFSLLYSDLVAEYQIEQAPIEEIRTQLRDAVDTEYRNAITAHKTIGRWLESLEELNSAQQASINELLQEIDPDLSVDSVDEVVKEAKNSLRDKISSL
jgi:hypothetical protein